MFFFYYSFREKWVDTVLVQVDKIKYFDKKKKKKSGWQRHKIILFLLKFIIASIQCRGKKNNQNNSRKKVFRVIANIRSNNDFHFFPDGMVATSAGTIFFFAISNWVDFYDIRAKIGKNGGFFFYIPYFYS